jgi:hypothetical protein
MPPHLAFQGLAQGPHAGPRRRTPAADGLPPDCLDAVGLLVQAEAHARAVGLGRWEFAVGLRELLDAGASTAALRRLVAEGLAEHAIELLRPDAPERSFRRVRSLAFTARACFVLTEEGLAGAGGWLARPLGAAAGPKPGPAGVAVPAWDPALRRLTFRGAVVKEFRRPAPSQELILAAFEEEGWPARIDDPLSGQEGRIGRDRLHDTIRGLNRHQERPLLWFGRDGTGEGVTWCPRREC